MPTGYNNRIFFLITFLGLTVSLPTRSQVRTDKQVVVMAISRTSILAAMESPPQLLSNGKVLIGITAFILPDGELRDPLCSSDSQVNCKLIQRTILSQPKTYTDISGEPGLRVTSIPDKVGECYETTAQGRTQGDLATTAVVTSQPAWFDRVQPKLAVTDRDRIEIQTSITQLFGKSRQTCCFPYQSHREVASDRHG